MQAGLLFGCFMLKGDQDILRLPGCDGIPARLDNARFMGGNSGQRPAG